MPFNGPFATIEDITRLGVRAAAVWCRACDHRAELPLDRFPPAMAFVSIRPRLICTSCGGRHAIECDPDWRGYRPGGRM